MTRISYSNGAIVDPAVICLWEDLSNERAGFFRAFWCTGPEATTGSPVIGYCSAGGSHRTLRATVSELRRAGYSDPVYRNGRLIDAGKPTLWRDVNPRAYPVPAVLRVDFGHVDGLPRFCIVGTAYGFLHTTGGDVRTWRTRSGAARVARAYQPF